MKSLKIALGVLMLSALSLSSCLKNDYDTPPDTSSVDPMIPVTHNIAQLKALNGLYNPTNGGDTTFIGEDIVISGIVTANDRSGNFYKQLVIQDDTSSIMILIDANNLYNDYPVGRKIYVKCKGLWLGYDGGLPVLGYEPNEQNGLNMIPQMRINDFIVKANIGNTVKADTVDLAAIKNAQARYYNRLVYIRDAEFVDTTKTYSNPNSTTNRDIEDCDGNTLVVRTSNYSNFANVRVPRGRGGITGIYTVFVSSSRSTPQLLIRDTADVQFRKSRCGEITGNILLREQFGSGTSGAINLTGWTNYAEVGGVKWTFGNSTVVPSRPYAQVTAYQSGQTSVISWLITPGIDLTAKINPRLSFTNADGHDNGATLEVLISTNYDGSNPTAATWTPLPANISKGHTSSFGPFISSGEINLNAYLNQTIHIAFRYTGADLPGDANETTTYEIDDVVVVTD